MILKFTTWFDVHHASGSMYIMLVRSEEEHSSSHERDQQLVGSSTGKKRSLQSLVKT